MARTLTGKFVDAASTVKGSMAAAGTSVKGKTAGEIKGGTIAGAKVRFDWKRGEKSRTKIESTLGSKWDENKYLSDLLNDIDKIRVIQAIESGLPYKSFEAIYKRSPFTQAFWAEALGLSIKSLNRYKQTEKRFKPLQSEKIIELAEVSDLGKKVFGNDADFELWLSTPSLALGNSKPIDLIKNSYGKELVVTELTNIDQGIFV